jgi:hypothetical protein
MFGKKKEIVSNCSIVFKHMTDNGSEYLGGLKIAPSVITWLGNNPSAKIYINNKLYQVVRIYPKFHTEVDSVHFCVEVEP